MIEEAYVSFETAKLLKEKGFNEPCLYYYFSNGKIEKRKGLKDRNCPAVNTFSMPTQQMAMRWLREVHNIIISIAPQNSKYYFTPWQRWNSEWVRTKAMLSLYDTYEQACEAAIKYCLKNLI